MKKQITPDNAKMFKGLSRLSDTLEWVSTLLLSDEDPDWILQTVYEAADEVTELIRLTQNSPTA